jgi:hypothetical protein
MLSHPESLQWLRNLGNGRFAEAGSSIAALKTPMVGRGLAVGETVKDLQVRWPDGRVCIFKPVALNKILGIRELHPSRGCSVPIDGL